MVTAIADQIRCDQFCSGPSSSRASPTAVPNRASNAARRRSLERACVNRLSRNIHRNHPLVFLISPSWPGLTRPSTSSLLGQQHDVVPGHRRAEATPSFGRLRPGMTKRRCEEMQRHRFVITTSRYSLGTTMLPSPARFMRTISACRSLCSSSCLAGRARRTPSAPGRRTS